MGDLYESQCFTGSGLRAARQKKGLSRRALAEIAKVHPDTVRYWERKALVDVLGYAPRRFATILIDGFDEQKIHREAREARMRPYLSPVVRVLQHIEARSVQCGAKTRQGHPCRCKSEPGKRRCRFHGGRSTGPRTAAGKARIAEAQRARWTAFREANNALAIGPEMVAA